MITQIQLQLNLADTLYGIQCVLVLSLSVANYVVLDVAAMHTVDAMCDVGFVPCPVNLSQDLHWNGTSKWRMKYDLCTISQ